MYQEEDHENEQKVNQTKYAKLVHKICGFYKWSYKDFRETPWWLIKELSRLLDEKESDMSQFVSYEEAAIFKNLRRMFGKKDD